ncbi:MAG TPA: DUF6691 family protein [Gemmatimonadales bacterium]|nr:DUF6691 family protein [Gemmatimonadales bacterium]
MLPALPLDPSLGGGTWPTLLIGAGFGFALERAGLGNPRKLVGQFYGYDFAVLQVMFTAIVTAMIGLQVLVAIGALDLGRVYLPPTYLVGQGVGGLIFGAGFVLGGYCPGTCLVGAVSGRLDALLAIAGMVTGMLIYSALTPVIQPVAAAGTLGPVTLPQLAHLSAGWVTVLIVGAALAVFVLLHGIERQRQVRA